MSDVIEMRRLEKVEDSVIRLEENINHIQRETSNTQKELSATISDFRVLIKELDINQKHYLEMLLHHKQKTEKQEAYINLINERITARLNEIEKAHFEHIERSEKYFNERFTTLEKSQNDAIKNYKIIAAVTGGFGLMLGSCYTFFKGV